MLKKIKDAIEKNGFFLSTFKENKDFLQHLLNVNEPNSETKAYAKSILKDFGLLSDKLHLVFEDFAKGDSICLHTHLTPCDFQILIWAHEKNFIGREFVYGKKKSLIKFKPSFGDICFMKTNDLDFVHGVERLESDSRVRTLLISYNYTGKLGEHLTIDSDQMSPV